jgi:F-type H+-transporting ATPase subunit c
MILPLLAEMSGSIHVGLAAMGAGIGVGLTGLGAAAAVGRNPGAATPILVHAILRAVPPSPLSLPRADNCHLRLRFAL